MPLIISAAVPEVLVHRMLPAVRAAVLLRLVSMWLAAQ